MAIESRRVIEWTETPGVPQAGELEALRVTAHVDGQLCLPSGHLSLDSLLAFHVVQISGIPPAPSGTTSQMAPVTIPVAEDRGVHLCSFSIGDIHEHETRFANRRPPIEKYVELGDGKGVVNLSLGVEKQYRVPYSVGHVEAGALTWFLVGYRAPVAWLLSHVHHIGRRVGIGMGRVSRWDVEPLGEFPWDGFPVLDTDGLALRPLPRDWPGLSKDCRVGFANLTYPYWETTREELCAIP